ncbi:MAG: siderophore-interacting protein [Citricoccus sp.]
MNTTEQAAQSIENLTGELKLHFQDQLVRRDLWVRRVEQITPRYRRIVLVGEDLAAGYPFIRFTPSDHVKVYFPDQESGTIVAYRETDDGWQVDSSEGAPIRRDYTPRAWDPASGELSLDFVVHEHGIAGAWARDAQPGDPLVVMGPRANWLLPQNYSHYLALGDETALPAIARLIEEAPAGAHVTALVEIAGPAEEQRLTPAEGTTADLRWVHRDSAPVLKGHLSALETAVRELELPTETSGLYVFAAGEAGVMKPIRRHFRRELGMPKHQISVDGYWKRGTADHDHHDNELDED